MIERPQSLTMRR